MDHAVREKIALDPRQRASLSRWGALRVTGGNMRVQLASR